MSEMNGSSADVVELSLNAMRDIDVPDGPPRELADATLDAIRSRAAESTAVRLPERRSLRLRLNRVGATAFVLAIIAGVAWSLLLPRSEAAFAMMLDRVKAMENVACVLKHAREGETRYDFKCYFTHQQARIDLQSEPKDAKVPARYIADLDKGVVLESLALAKVARVGTAEEFGSQWIVQKKSPLHAFLELSESAKVERVQDEVVEGVKCTLYHLSDAKFLDALPLGPIKIWVDRQTLLPVKVLVRERGEEYSFEGFRWNQDLDETLFEMRAPDGFRLLAGDEAKQLFGGGVFADDRIQPEGGGVFADDRIQPEGGGVFADDRIQPEGRGPN